MKTSYGQESLGSAALTYIVITPGGDLAAKAGTEIHFSAIGYDEFDNPIPGLLFTWSLVDCTSCIGEFGDSVLFTTRVGQGRARVTSGGVSATSGFITVTPGDLNRMVLQISSTQLVNQPLKTSASLILYDAFNNLKTDYNLTQNPIELISDEGVLVPSILNENGLQIGGVVRLLSAGIVYQGLSATTGVRADNGLVVSNSVVMSFNAYDVLDALDADGETIERTYANHNAQIRVPLTNRGNLLPTTTPLLTASFRSSGNFTQVPFVPTGTSIVDTIVLDLPEATAYPLTDTLQLVVDAAFTVGSQTYNVADTQIFSVDILSPAIFSLIGGSFEPDTILGGHPFNVAFDVASGEFAQVIDSTVLEIHLADRLTNAVLATLFSGVATPISVESGLISYAGLEALLDTSAFIGANGWYRVHLAYSLYSEGNVFTLEEPVTDSLYAIFDVNLSYNPGSFQPSVVYAGSDAVFRFGIIQSGTVPLAFHRQNSRFTVYDGSFSTTTNLLLSRDSLLPGNNNLTTSNIFIPLSQLNGQLNAMAEFSYCVPGVPDTFYFQTSFDATALPIRVVELPTVQIVNVRIVAPNSPKVNTSQTFQFEIAIANLSNTHLDSLALGMISDGSSSFEPIFTGMEFPPHDTTNVLVSVVASSIPTAAEVFRFGIISSDVNVSPAIRDFALLTIETPAEISLNYDVIGASGLILDRGTNFVFRVLMTNLGSAAISSGDYRLIVSGLNDLKPDTLAGTIVEGISLEFANFAPNKDTTLRFDFSLTRIPTDLNAGTSAAIQNPELSVELSVVSTDAQLFLSTLPLGTNVLRPGQVRDLFQIDLTNTGFSSVTGIKLDKIELRVEDMEGNPLAARDIFNTGNTGFYDDETRVTTTTSGDNRLVFSFDDYIIQPSEMRTLVLKTELKTVPEGSLVIKLADSGLAAYFIEGPNAGQLVEVTSNEDGSNLISQEYTFGSAFFANSFVISTNPFNPEEGTVEFAYQLAQDADMEFRVFTLTGEEVFALNFAAGSQGGSSGENTITWDGRNSDGDVVLNGVYIAIIQNPESGENSRIKVAVLK